MDHARRRLMLGTLCLTVARAACADEAFPSRPVRLIVPYTAGGSVDSVARIVGRSAEGFLRQPVIIDNRAGANTSVGTGSVARSKPDGYTLLLATNPFTSNPSLYATVPYDAEKDFAPVINLGSSPSIIAVNGKLGVKTLKGLLEMAKANPGKLEFATAGVGSVPHIAGEMLALKAGVKLQHVPYKGGAQASNDVIAGQVPILISGLAAAVPFVKSGALVPLAVTGAKRAPLLPDVPTVAELGFPGFESTSWLAVLAPRGTPKAVVDELNKVFNAVVGKAETRQQLAAIGVDVTGGTTAQVESFLRDDMRQVSALIKATGMKLND